MRRRYHGVIFDLDGTLADTVADIAGCANECAGLLGREPLPVERYRSLVGDGVTCLAERLLGTTDEKIVGDFVEAFRARLGEWQVRTTTLYPGIAELLQALLDRGIRCAVVSNKPQHLTEGLLRHLAEGFPFAAVFGQRSEVPRKPDPTAVLEACSRMGLRPQAVLHVGDTATDIETARNAGLAPVGVCWGFRSARELVGAGAAALVVRPAQILDLLDGLPAAGLIATERLILRPTLAEDLPAIELFWKDEDANYLDHGSPDPGVWQENTIERLRCLLARRPSFTMWTLLLPPSLDAIGYVRLRRHSLLSGRGTMGVRLGRAWWGHGYGPEALTALCSYFSRVKRLRLLDLEVLADNRRAVRAYEKAGFALTGNRERSGRLWLSLEWHAPD